MQSRFVDIVGIHDTLGMPVCFVFNLGIQHRDHPVGLPVGNIITGTVSKACSEGEVDKSCIKNNSR